MFLEEHPFCAWHGAPVKATISHHPSKRSLPPVEQYLSLEGCIPLCQKCHFAVKNHLKLCPICKEHYFKPNRRKHKDQCWTCFSATEFGRTVKTYYEAHPQELQKKMRKKVSTKTLGFLPKKKRNTS